eukprot:6177121-Pleurochrysis_carterae.AAC.1
MWQHSLHVSCASGVFCRVLTCRTLCFCILQLEQTDAHGRLISKRQVRSGHLHDESVNVARFVVALTHALQNFVNLVIVMDGPTGKSNKETLDNIMSTFASSNSSTQLKLRPRHVRVAQTHFGGVYIPFGMFREHVRLAPPLAPCTRLGP